MGNNWDFKSFYRRFVGWESLKLTQREREREGLRCSSFLSWFSFTAQAIYRFPHKCLSRGRYSYLRFMFSATQLWVHSAKRHKKKERKWKDIDPRHSTHTILNYWGPSMYKSHTDPPKEQQRQSPSPSRLISSPIPYPLLFICLTFYRSGNLMPPSSSSTVRSLL